ncbi:MAG TPA: thiol:disulfide interchange protein DsbA/DsbL [Guyparkeria sp.]|nr:thiol:disulfide interchange protein DsbA/DsbL [Guyparkeria sp.]
MTIYRMRAMLLQRLKTGFITLFVALLMAVSTPSLAATATDGYLEVRTDVSSPDGKILVQEFFWYGCSHCFNLEAVIGPWSNKLPEDVVFERRALALGQHWLPLTQAFYAADQLDAVEVTHDEIFRAIHLDRKRLMDMDSIADFYAKLGVDREAFVQAYEGFSVQNEIRKTGQIAQEAGVSGVPALLVDGRYLVTGELAGSNAEMLRVVDKLIATIRDERD